MRKNFKLLGAVAVAGLVAAGGSAFTAANTGVTAAYVGYASASVTGVTVSNVNYVVNQTNPSKLSSIVFTESEDVTTGYKATLTLDQGTSPLTVSSCLTTTINTITCDTTANVAAVVGVALTVAHNTSV